MILEIVCLMIIIVGLFSLLILLLRYGPVFRGYIKLTNAQQQKLEKANKEYVDALRVTEPPTPTGEVLYKTSLISHDGLAVYDDGIYAKFGIGRKGKYKLKRFDEISDIFPVEAENPLAKPDSMFTGPSYWEALQIETNAYEVIVVDSRKHNFDKLMPVLLGAFGTLWNNVYHDSEVIRDRFINSNIGVHSYIRGREAIKVSEPKPAARTGLPLEKDESRGSLLYEESQEIMKAREQALTKLSIILGVVGVVLIGIAIGMLLFSFSETCVFTVSVIFIVIGAACFVICIKLLQVSRNHYTTKIYENGIQSFMVGTGEEIFIPFGQFVTVIEGASPFEGEVYKLLSKDGRFNLALNKKIPKIEKYIDHIKQQMVKPELDYQVQATQLRPMLKKFEYASYIILLAISLMFSYYISASFAMGEPLIFLIFFLIFIFVSIGLIAVFMVGWQFISIYKKNKSKIGINLSVVGFIFIVLVALFFTNYFIVLIDLDGSATLEVRQDPMPTDAISLNLLFNDTQLELNNNLVLEAGESLKIFNSTLIFNCSVDKEYSIWVGEGSRLELVNCTVRPKGERCSYGFEIYGEAHILNTEIISPWGDKDYNNLDGGIEIYSDDVTIVNSTIRDCKTNGIFIWKCSPTISGNTIRNCKDDGLEIYYSNANISGNVIHETEWGLILGTDADVRLEHNTIQDNTHGIDIRGASPEIRNNMFIRNSETAVEYDYNSDPKLVRNYYEDNGEDINSPVINPYLFLGICAVVIITLAVVFFSFLYYLNTKYFGKPETEYVD